MLSEIVYKGPFLNEELLAVILSGDMGALNAENLLNTFDCNLIHLFCASIDQLMETEGIGPGEAFKIKVVFELTKRIAAYCEEDHPKIASKDDVTKLLAPHMMFLPLINQRIMHVRHHSGHRSPGPHHHRCTRPCQFQRKGVTVMQRKTVRDC